MGFLDKKKDKLPIAHGLTTPNTSVDDAVDIVQNNPSGYTSKYGKLSEDALNEYLNREPFEFDLNGDALYQQYKDKYIQQGKMAMMDTMGQAAAMTGGYGNSYAQSVGQQAYAAQLQNLNDVVPELYQMALDNYNREGEEMLNKYAIYSGLEERDYERYWSENERDYERAWDEREYDRLYGEPDLVYPNWYNEGGEYASIGEANQTDYENLYKYLGLDGTPAVNAEFIKAAKEMTGIKNGNEAVEAAIQMMNREVKYYATTDLATVEAKAKTFTNNEALEAYLDGEMARGLSKDDAMRIYKMYKQPDTE